MYDCFMVKVLLIWWIGIFYKNLYDNICYILYIYIYWKNRNIKRRVIMIIIYFIKVIFWIINVFFKKGKFVLKNKW